MLESFRFSSIKITIRAILICKFEIQQKKNFIKIYVVGTEIPWQSWIMNLIGVEMNRLISEEMDRNRGGIGTFGILL